MEENLINDVSLGVCVVDMHFACTILHNWICHIRYVYKVTFLLCFSLIYSMFCSIDFTLCCFITHQLFSKSYKLHSPINERKDLFQMYNRFNFIRFNKFFLIPNTLHAHRLCSNPINLHMLP